MTNDGHFTFLTTRVEVDGNRLFAIPDFHGSFQGKEPSHGNRIYIVGGMTGSSTECLFESFLGPDPLTGKLVSVGGKNDIPKVAIEVTTVKGDNIPDICDEGYFVFTDLPETVGSDIDKEEFYLARLRALSDTAMFYRFFMEASSDNAKISDQLRILNRLLALTCLNMEYVLLETKGNTPVGVKNVKGEGNYVVYSDSTFRKSGLDIGKVSWKSLLERAAQDGSGLFFNMDENMRAPLSFSNDAVRHLLNKLEGLNTQRIQGFRELASYLFGENAET